MISITAGPEGHDVVWEELEDGCIVPSLDKSKYADYFFELITSKTANLPRIVWHLEKRPFITSQIFHVCGNEACCNIGHMDLCRPILYGLRRPCRLLAEHQLEALRSWLAEGGSGSNLAESFSGLFCPNTARKWIKKWKSYGLKRPTFKIISGMEGEYWVVKSVPIPIDYTNIKSWWHGGCA
jgi:hypothetical protein